MKNNVEEILKKYQKQIKDQGFSSSSQNSINNEEISKDFNQFKKDMLPNFNNYERWCNNLGRIIKIKASKKDTERINKDIEGAHLNITADQVISLSFLSFIAIFFFGFILSAAIYLINYSENTDISPILLVFFLFFLFSGFSFYYFFTMPSRLANQWRLKAGSQFVSCILYTVIYMKHTSNLERAINFAAQNLDPPLALDLKKVFWDVEIGKYSTLKESLDNYLESWRNTNTEFIESFNLIESSLYEPNEARRIQILERSLQVILEGVYDKMLKYSHEVKAPLTNIYMLGIVLPTLALALLPLASALLKGAIKWYHVFVLFNLIIPFFVFYMTNEIMMKRPGGYGETSILELNPNYSKYKSKKIYFKAGLITLPMFLLGIVPLLWQFEGFRNIFGFTSDYTFNQIGLSFLGDAKLFDYIAGAGPMGLFSLILSLFIPLSIILFFAITYKTRTKDLIKSRNFSKELELEFNNSLFQLGNRIGDGTPAELAFGRVSESAKGQVTENFFRAVHMNIQSLGMSLEKAIFDSKRGAIIDYPSNLIATSMRILVEGVKKGLRVAADSLMSIADYIRNINKINERLKDLLADVSSDMKSNMTFLAPLLAGIVVGLGAMITAILSKLASVYQIIQESGGDLTGLSNIGQLIDLFNVKTLIPPYFLQIAIGIYIIEIVFILTKALVTVDSGQDELKETYDKGNNLLSAGLLYLIVAFIAIIILSIIAGVALNSFIIS